MKKNVILLSLVTVLFAFSACIKDDDEFFGTDTNGHEYVDLGLSVKWATCNVGASSPEEYGEYFAWGEISPKEEYKKKNSVTYGDSLIGDISGNPQYDAATVNWGGSWRLPTKVECQELTDNCDSEFKTYHGVDGILFTSRVNGNSIFIPAAGYYRDSTLRSEGTRCCYWNGTPNEINCHFAYRLYFSKFVQIDCDFWGERYNGYTIRPVTN